MRARAKSLDVTREDWRSGNHNALHGRLDPDKETWSVELNLLGDAEFLTRLRDWLDAQDCGIDTGALRRALAKRVGR